MYPYVTFVKISSVGFLPPPPPPPCSLDSPLPFFSLSPLWVARAWLSVLLFCKLFPSNIYIYIYIFFFCFVLFCFVFFFVVRNPHLYKFLSRLSRKGCRDEGGGGGANWSIRVTENVIKISGGIMLLFTFDGNSATVRKLVRQQEWNGLCIP